MQEQKNNSFIAPAIILAGFLIAVGIYFANKDDTSVTTNTNQEQTNTQQVSDTSHIRGNPNAQITIIEFSDTECPYCKMFQTTMQTVINTYGKDGKVAWVYKHFPIDSLHSKSRKEAEATECAYELGGNTAFWKMLDTIYAKTTSNNGLDASKLPEFAKEAGVDVTDFNTCLSSGKYASLVESNFQEGVSRGVNGTPYSALSLKTALSSDAETSILNFILKNNLSQYITISSDKKEINLNGGLPIEVFKFLIETITK